MITKRDILEERVRSTKAELKIRKDAHERERSAVKSLEKQMKKALKELEEYNQKHE